MSMIELTSAELRKAAGEALGVADVVGTARQASGAALPGDAFGILCSPLFLPAYLPVQAAADLLIDAAGSAVERAAKNLNAAADEFDSTDGAVRADFQGYRLS